MDLKFICEFFLYKFDNADKILTRYQLGVGNAILIVWSQSVLNFEIIIQEESIDSSNIYWCCRPREAVPTHQIQWRKI